MFELTATEQKSELWSEKRYRSRRINKFVSVLPLCNHDYPEYFLTDRFALQHKAWFITSSNRDHDQFCFQPMNGLQIYWRRPVWWFTNVMGAMAIELKSSNPGHDMKIRACEVATDTGTSCGQGAPKRLRRAVRRLQYILYSRRREKHS